MKVSLIKKIMIRKFLCQGCFSWRLKAAHPGVDTLVQTVGMSEPAREAFLEVFGADNEETVVGFAVMASSARRSTWWANGWSGRSSWG